MANVKQITSCRICNNEELITIFDLGDLMINCFVEEPGDHKGEAPLKLQRCSECDLIQLSHTVREEDLYTNYWYLSRLNKKIVDNLESIVEDAQKECPLEDDDIIIDIGANDGTLLSFYPDNVITVGVDPAENIHAELKEHNVRTFCVSPGPIKTSMGHEIIKNENPDEDFMSFMNPVEIAEFILHIISYDNEMISEEVRLSRIN